MLADKIDTLGQIVRADDGVHYLFAMHDPKGEFEEVWRFVSSPTTATDPAGSADYWNTTDLLSAGPHLNTLDGVEVELVTTLQDLWPNGIAFILDEEGHQIDDVAMNWETAQNYALNEGRKVVVFKGDGHLDKDEIQNLCDRERALYRDCRGLPEDPKTT